MFEFIITVLTLLIYYVFFIKIPPTSKTTTTSSSSSTPDPHYVTTPYKVTFNHTSLKVDGSSLSWKFPNLPPKYKWKNNKITQIDSCLGEMDGAFVPGITSIQSYIQNNNNNQQRSFITSHVIDNRNLTLDYFFECKNETENKLFFCPKGTFFDKVTSACVDFDICHKRQDKYRFSSAKIEKTQFYECHNNQAQLKSCPAGEIFDRITDKCKIPDDLCIFHADNYILKFDRTSYTECYHNVSRKRYCSHNEYFHPQKKLCVSSLCENKDGNVPNEFITDKFWRYIPSYTVCDQGIPLKSEECPQEFNNDIIEMPQRLIFDTNTKTCTPPDLCKNIFPQHTYIPGHDFRRFVNNYKHSDIYDSLYGFECKNDKPQKVEMLPGKKIALSDGKMGPICQKSDMTKKYPIITDPVKYFNCQSQNVETCSSSTDEIFDYGKQSCYKSANLDKFHKFGSLPLFRTTGLSPYNDWFDKRSVRNTPDLVCSSSDFYYDSIVHSCVHVSCKNFNYLAKIPDAKIYINGQHYCEVNNTGTEVALKNYHFKGLYLNFWEQSFSRQEIINPQCKRGSTRLKSTDSFLNAILYPTCEFIDNFAVCPSVQTYKILGSPALCYPRDQKQKIYWDYIEPSNSFQSFYKSETDSILILEEDTNLVQTDIDKKGNVVEENKIYAKLTSVKALDINYSNAAFQVKTDKRVQIKYTLIATNHPTYFIKHNLSRSGHNVSTNRFKVSYKMNLNLERYDIAESITGFQ